MCNKLIYSAMPSAIPDILQNDWAFTFRDDEEKEILIKIFSWWYGVQGDNQGITISDWFLGDSTQFTAGFLNGKLSFTLKKDDLPLLKIFLCLVMTAISFARSDYLIGSIRLAELAEVASRINLFKSGSRCIFLRAVEVTNNNSSVEISSHDLFPHTDSERVCGNIGVFTCDWLHENSCIMRQADFDKEIKNLIDKKAIRSLNGKYHIM